jgi:hypothetical protein
MSLFHDQQKKKLIKILENKKTILRVTCPFAGEEGGKGRKTSY